MKTIEVNKKIKWNVLYNTIYKIWNKNEPGYWCSGCSLAWWLLPFCRLPFADDDFVVDVNEMHSNFVR